MSQVPGAVANPFGFLRDFLQGAKYGTLMDLVDAALQEEEPGEVLLVEVYEPMRVKRQRRRSMTTFAAAPGHSPWPRWHAVFAHRVYTMWQLCRKMTVPEETAIGPHIATSRGMRRVLSRAGIATDRLSPLEQQAHARLKAIWRSMEWKQTVVVDDNRFQRRRCRDSTTRLLNVNSISVLHTTEIAMYRIFPTLDDLFPMAAHATKSTNRDFQ